MECNYIKGKPDGEYREYYANGNLKLHGLYINGLEDPRGIIPENHNPRGWSGYVIGDQLVFGTLEYRLPFIPRTASINLISDYANVWNKNKQIKEVVTFGYELRISLGPISISVGDAQTNNGCLLYTSPSPRDLSTSRMPSSA